MNSNLQQSVSSSGRRPEILFWCFAVAVLFVYLGHNALWGSENRWAEITREMILTGDYLHPAINWQIYFDKPQLSYWFIVPFMLLFGTAELAARIPSALAALVALYGTVEIGKSLYDRQTGLLAGWLTLGCYGFLFWGRVAAADMANVAAIVLAVSFFYKVGKHAGFFAYLGFYLILFLGALTKGLPAVVIPIAFLSPHLLHRGNWEAHLKISHLAAFLLCVGLYLLPFWIAAVTPPTAPLHYPVGDGPALSGLELVWRENIVRAFCAFDHKDPSYSYLYNLPRILLPWFLLVLPAIVGRCRKKEPLSEPGDELISGILIIFILFTASTSRRWYYILPLAPFCMVLGAAAIRRGLEENDPWTLIPLRGMRCLMIVAAGLAVATVAIGPVIPPLFKVEPPLIAQIGVPLLGALAGAVLLLENHPRTPVARWSGLPQRLAATVIAGDILLAAGLCILLPSLTAFRTGKSFCRMISDVLADFDSGSILSIGSVDADFLFYSGRRDPVVHVSNECQDGETFDRFIREHAGRKVAIFGLRRDINRFFSGSAAKYPIKFNPELPDYVEPSTIGSGKPEKRRGVWIIEVPAAFPEPTSSPTESKP